jgi:uncharacterized protein
MMTVPCYLAPSRIEGLGVYCREDLRQGQSVWSDDPILDLRVPAAKFDTVPAHVREFLERYTYPDLQRPGFFILEADEGKFMNHAEDPNLDFSGGVTGYARWDIPAGAELTCNYGEFGDGDKVMQPPRHRVGGD